MVRGVNEEQKVDIAMRVVADHLRAVAFSIADGQLPSNARQDMLSADPPSCRTLCLYLPWSEGSLYV